MNKPSEKRETITQPYFFTKSVYNEKHQIHLEQGFQSYFAIRFCKAKSVPSTHFCSNGSTTVCVCDRDVLTNHCGGQNVGTSCLNNPGQTFQCIPTDVESHTQYGTTLLPPLQAQTTPQFLLVAGKITFTEDYKFAPGSEIVFLENTSGFKIGTNKKLTLESCSLHGCTKLWAGVEVTWGSKLFAWNCTFRDGKAAIILRDGSIIEATGNTFEKNVCGILGAPSNPAFLNNSITLASAKGISGNTFDGSGLLLQPTQPATIDPGVANAVVQNVVLSYPFVGIWIEKVAALTIGHLKSLASNPNLLLNTFQNFGNVQEGSPYSVQNMGIYSFRSNLTVRNSRFSNIGLYNPLNIGQNSNAVGVYALNQTTDIAQTTIIGTKEKPGLNTFSDCFNDIQTVGTHLTVSGVVSYKSGECVYASMANSWQNPIKVSIKDNDFTLFRGRAVYVNYFKPITVNIEDNYLSDNNEPYDPAQRFGIQIVGNGWSVLSGSRVYNNQIRSNGILLGGAFVGIALNQAPYLTIEGNNIYEKLQGFSSLGAFYGIFTVGTPSNGIRLYSNNINGAKIDYAYASGIRIGESVNTVLNCNATNNTNAGIVFFGNCDNADLSKNRFNYHGKGLSLGDPLIPTSISNIIGLQSAKENRWFGTTSPIEAFALNEASALASLFEVNSSNLSSDYWPFPRKIGTMDDNFTWFKPLIGQEPSNDFTCLTTEVPDPPCDNCEYELAASDTHTLNGTYLPPLDFPALDWEARWHFADRLNRNMALQNADPAAAQYFQNTYNDTYSRLNRVYQNYRNCWQPGSSLAENVNALSISLQALIEQRFALDGLLSEDWEENASLHVQMADADLNIADAAEILGTASADFISFVNQNITALLQELESVDCSEVYELDMKSVIRTALQTHFTDGGLTGQQSTEMQAIADKCRYSGGYAVVLARSFFEPKESYEQDAGCGLGERSASGTAQGENLNGDILYPNPASNLLNIRPGQDFGTGTARIFNSLGILQKSVDFEAGNAQISLAGLRAGYYVVEIGLDGKQALRQPFIKID